MLKKLELLHDAFQAANCYVLISCLGYQTNLRRQLFVAQNTPHKIIAFFIVIWYLVWLLVY